MEEKEKLQTPAKWCEELDARVIDPDGWRDGSRSWDDPIDFHEFHDRFMRCTVDTRGWPYFVNGRPEED